MKKIVRTLILICIGIIAYSCAIGHRIDFVKSGDPAVSPYHKNLLCIYALDKAYSKKVDQYFILSGNTFKVINLKNGIHKSTRFFTCRQNADTLHLYSRLFIDNIDTAPEFIERIEETSGAYILLKDNYIVIVDNNSDIFSKKGKEYTVRLIDYYGKRKKAATNSLYAYSYNKAYLYPMVGTYQKMLTGNTFLTEENISDFHTDACYRTIPQNDTLSLIPIYLIRYDRGGFKYYRLKEDASDEDKQFVVVKGDTLKLLQPSLFFPGMDRMGRDYTTLLDYTKDIVVQHTGH